MRISDWSSDVCSSDLCENWSRDFAADLDRCGNAISHDSLHRWSGEWDLNYSCQVSKKGPGPASLPGPRFDCQCWAEADYSAAQGTSASFATSSSTASSARTGGNSQSAGSPPPAHRY